MPWANNHLPKYRRHRASGQAIVTINGRDHYLGPHGTSASRLEYDQLISEWLAGGRSRAYGTSGQDYTIVELIADYLRYARQYYGEGRRGTYATMVRALKPLDKLYGDTPAIAFGALKFKTVRQSLVDQDLSRRHINELMRRIVSVFRWGAAEGHFPASAPQNLAIIPGLRKGRCGVRESAPVRPVEDDVVEATLPRLSPIVASMVRLQRLTGARPGEICALRPCDIDRSGEIWEARLEAHKTAHHGQDRTIYIGPHGQQVLLPYLLRPVEAMCFSPAEAVEQMRNQRNAQRKTAMSCGNRIGTNRRRRPRRLPGDRYTTQSYGVAIHRACDRAFPHPNLSTLPVKDLTADQLAELKAWRAAHRWNPNQLRHALGTRIRREFDLDAASTVLGDSQVATTQIYAEKDRQRAIDVVRRIG